MKSKHNVGTHSIFSERINRILMAVSLLGLLIGGMAPIVVAAVQTSITIQSSPNPALTTDTVKISGILTGASKPLGNQKVQVQYSKDAKTNWVGIASALTQSDGSYAVDWKSPGEGEFYLQTVFSGNKQYRSQTSNILTQTVNSQPASTQTQMRRGANALLNNQRASMAKSAGITWARRDVDFGSQFQTMYSSAQTYGINFVGILDYYTLGFNASFTLEDWTNAVRRAQSSYPYIHVWEIWNEPTLTKFQLGYMDGTPQHYFELLKSAYVILKAGDPIAIVLGLGGAQFESSRDRTFTSSVFSLGGSSYMDAISVHAYPYDLNIGQTWSYYQNLWTQDIQYYSQFGKYMWLTETGLKSTQNSDSDQATYLTNSFQFFQGKGLVAYFWYQLNDYTDSTGNIISYGLLRVDYSTKPAYSVYRSLAG